MNANESVMDFPKETLSPDVWHIVMDEDGQYEVYRMLSPIHDKLIAIVRRLCEICNYSAENTYCHVTGSITSNTYTENADVDLHILFKDAIRQLPTMTQAEFRDAFEQLKKEDPDCASIGKHPIEVYFQPNEFQDMMSVGCYDVTADKWIVGPELKPMDYNPYDELYAKVKKKSAALVKNVRNIILDVYEKAVVMLKSGEHETPNNMEEDAWVDLRKALKEAATLYQSARNMRRSYSDPSSKEQALKYRQSTKWKIADASFKMMDKFGYLAILKEFSELVEGPLDGSVCLEIADKVLSTVKNYINNADKLAEEDNEKVRESIREISSKIKVLVEKLKPMLNAQIVLLSENKLDKDERVQYVNDFKDYFGYMDEYSPKDSVKEVANWIAHECTLQMPTDTAAREVEGDAVMLLMLKGNDKQAEAGKKLGDCMMHKTKHDDKTLLKHMRQAYLELIGLENDEQRKKENNKKDAEEVNEGIKKTISAAAIVALMAIPGILPKSSLAAELKGKPISTLTVNSPQMKDAISKASPKKINGLNLANVTNAIARTIYAEAAGEGQKGQDAVASVIWNRAGGKSANMIAVISKAKQFSCWNDYLGGWVDEKYKYKIPTSVFTNPKSKEAWDYCVLLAAKLVSEEFTSTIGNRNSYMNKATADKSNVDSWGKSLDMKIGKHHFGYLKNNDGFKGKTQTSSTYVVKKGDTLSTIAKAHKTTAAELAAKNNIKDLNKISIGQKIKV